MVSDLKYNTVLTELLIPLLLPLVGITAFLSQLFPSDLVSVPLLDDSKKHWI